MTDSNPDLKKNAVVFTAILLFLLFAYLPVIQGYYVYHDDVLFFSMQKGVCESHSTFEFVKGDVGRPLAAYYVCAIGTLLDSIESANFFRFISVVFTALAAFLLFLWLRKHSMSLPHALLIAVFIFILPPSQSHISYLSNGYQAIALCMSAGVAFLAHRAIVRDSSWWPPVNGHSVSAVILLLFTLGTYQPSAMFYWAMMGALLLKIDLRTWKEERRKVIQLYLIPYVAMGLFFFYIILRPSHLPGHGVSSDFAGKFFWFFREPFVEAANLWNIFPSKSFAGSVVCMIALGALIELASALKNRPYGVSRQSLFSNFTQKYALVLSLFPLSLTANLAAISPTATYRTLTGLTALFALGLYWTFFRLESVVSGQYKRLLTSWILVATVVVGAYHAHYNVMNYFAFSQTLNLRYYKSAIYQNDLSKFDRIHVLHPDYWQGPDHTFVAPEKTRYDEFHLVPTDYAQDIFVIVKVAVDELGFKTSNVTYPSWGMTFDIMTTAGSTKTINVSYSTKKEYKEFLGKTLLIDLTNLSHFY